MAVSTEGIKQRKTAVQVNGKAAPNIAAEKSGRKPDYHPAGPVKHGGPMQALRIFLFGLFFTVSCLL